MKVVIVGGVAGGATAAARLRRLDEHAEIVVIERTGYVSYANCGLPYHVGGVIEDRARLTLQTPESFWRRFRIDVRTRQEVVAIDRTARVVTVRRLDAGDETWGRDGEGDGEAGGSAGTTYTESYDKLILSPGAKPSVPSLPGVDSKRLFTLRTVEDALAIAGFIDTHAPRTATVVGGGFIGLEMAENLVGRGLEVSVVQRGSHVMPTLDEDMASVLHNNLRSHGVHLVLNAAVTGFEEAGDGARESAGMNGGSSETTGAGVATNTGEGGHILTHVNGRAPLASDIVVLAVGVTPDSGLARDAGLELGLRGSILVDEHMRTSDPDIYAVGDAVQVTNVVTDQPALIALAGPANKQGRIAADNICGIESTFAGSQGTSVMKCFDVTVATTGLTEKAARGAGLTCDAAILTPPSHATYYPGSHPLVLKVVFERPGGRILGAQAIGREGIDKRIDVLAVAIRARMTARDLAELDLAYAPPYSSAKDPVNMAGYVIENLLDGLVEQVRWQEALDLPEGCTLLDTRTDAEYGRGRVEGALHVPLDELRDRIDELPRDKMIYVYCQSGLRSYLACRILAQHGLACKNVAGGYGFLEQALLDKAQSRQTECTDGVGPCGMRG